MVHAFSYGDTALVETFVVGREVAVPVMDTEDGPQALPVVGISPDGGVYDYTARYTAGSTVFDVPADLPAETARACAEVAVAAHRTLGLRDLSRSDLIVDAQGRVWFLEVNDRPRPDRDLDGPAGRGRRRGGPRHRGGAAGPAGGGARGCVGRARTVA